MDIIFPGSRLVFIKHNCRKSVAGSGKWTPVRRTHNVGPLGQAGDGSGDAGSGDAGSGAFHQRER